MKSVLRKSVIIGARRDDTGKAEPVIQNLTETYKFNIGDEVKYTNSNGVYLGVRKIIGREKISYSAADRGYYIDPTDTPWYAVAEERLVKA